jgi:hypothetical protein
LTSSPQLTAELVIYSSISNSWRPSSGSIQGTRISASFTETCSNASRTHRRQDGSQHLNLSALTQRPSCYSSTRMAAVRSCIYPTNSENSAQDGPRRYGTPWCKQDSRLLEGIRFYPAAKPPPPRSRIYMAHCLIYRGANPNRYAPKGLLKLIPPPTEQLSTFCIDLVMDLPRSNQVHDAILPITDRLTKWVRVLQGRKDWSAKDWAKEYYERMYEDVGLPEKMISDRDGRSLSAFWQEICSLANVDCSRVVETLMTSCSVASFARTSSCTTQRRLNHRFLIKRTKARHRSM